MSTTNQEIIEARLASYIDGEVDPAERAEIESHLGQNPQYRRLLEDLRKTRDLLRTLPREPAPPEFADAFFAQLERSGLLDGDVEVAKPRMRIGGPRVLAAAAIVLLAVGLGITVYFVLPGHDIRRVSIAQGPAAPQGFHPGVAPATPVEPNPNLSIPTPATPDLKRSEVEAQRSLAPIPVAPASPQNRGGATVSAPPQALAPLAPVKPGGQAQGSIDRGSIGTASGEKSITDAAPTAPLPLRPAVSLEQLAADMSEDPRVKYLLGASSSGASRLRAARPASPGVVLAVRPANLDHLSQELDRFLRDHRLAARSTQQSADVALDNWLSDSAAHEADLSLGATPEAKQRALAMADGAGRDRIEQSGQQQNQSADLTAGSAEQRTLANAAKGAGVGRGGQAPGSALAPATAVAQDAAPPVATAPPAAAPSAAANGNSAHPGESLYLVRHLSRQQAHELATLLAQGGDVRQAPVPSLDYRAADPGADNPAALAQPEASESSDKKVDELSAGRKSASRPDRRAAQDNLERESAADKNAMIDQLWVARSEAATTAQPPEKASETFGAPRAPDDSARAVKVTGNLFFDVEQALTRSAYKSLDALSRHSFGPFAIGRSHIPPADAFSRATAEDDRVDALIILQNDPHAP